MCMKTTSDCTLVKGLGVFNAIDANGGMGIMKYLLDTNACIALIS